MDRMLLEAMALETCPAELYYELVDALDETPIEDLYFIINMNLA